MAADGLGEYLAYAGFLACNVNPHMPSLSDAGYGWADVTALIESHRLFYCKAYRGRTLYLSDEAYFLLKRCRPQEKQDEPARTLLALLERSAPMEADELRAATLMEPRRFNRTFDFLLANLYVTAYGVGRVLNPNWSTFRYCTAGEWERCAKKPREAADPLAALKTIWARTMPEDEFRYLLK